MPSVHALFFGKKILSKTVRVLLCYAYEECTKTVINTFIQNNNILFLNTAAKKSL